MLLQKGWLVIDDQGKINHVSSPTQEQMEMLQSIITIVEYELTLPDKGEREAALLYLQNSKEAATRFRDEQSSSDPSGE